MYLYRTFVVQNARVINNTILSTIWHFLVSCMAQDAPLSSRSNILPGPILGGQILYEANLAGQILFEDHLCIYTVLFSSKTGGMEPYSN